MYKGSIRIDLSYSLPITHGFVKAYILDKGGLGKEVRLFGKSRTSLAEKPVYYPSGDCECFSGYVMI